MFATRSYEAIRPSFKRNLRHMLRNTTINVITEINHKNILPVKKGIRGVYYHNVFDDEVRTFDAQLRFLKDYFKVISCSKAIELIENGNINNEYVCISFDDGFANNYFNAMDLLLKHRLSACFFVCPDFVDLSDNDIEYHIEYSINRCGLDMPVRNMNWDMLAELVKNGFEIGSHGLFHDNLVNLSLEDARRAINLSKKRIEDNLKIECIHYSWPYGEKSYFSSLLASEVAKAGYRACWSAIRGLNQSGQDRYWLYRDVFTASSSISEFKYFLGRS